MMYSQQVNGFIRSRLMTPGTMERFAEILAQNAPPTLSWHLEQMPEERHSTIYHPAALRAFRALFKPEASRER